MIYTAPLGLLYTHIMSDKDTRSSTIHTLYA